MAFDKRSLDDYNDVASRLKEFFAKYSEGSLQADCNFAEVDGRPVVVVKAQAYRTPDDTRPGQGHAYEFVPGLTPYTKDSELQNAETAAWGRAIMAVGAADAKKGIASREEVRNRRGAELSGAVESGEYTVSNKSNALPSQTMPMHNREGQDALLKACQGKGLDPAAVAQAFQDRFGKHPRFSGNDELMAFALLVDEGAITLGVG